MINRVVLVGRTTKEPILRKTQDGKSVASFTIACNRIGKKDEADFISCTAWKEQADFIASYIHAGHLIGVEGRITTGSYEKDGKKVYTTEVTCTSVQSLQPKDKTEEKPKEEPKPKVEDNANYEELDIPSDQLPW